MTYEYMRGYETWEWMGPGFLHGAFRGMIQRKDPPLVQRFSCVSADTPADCASKITPNQWSY